MISKAIIEKFLIMAGKELHGEWILLGGAVIPLIDKSIRVTYDIDFVSKSDSSNTELLKLFKVAEKLNLPVETINSSAGFFLRKIPKWEANIVILFQSKSCTIYRPNVNLFIELKINRMSESDLLDCQSMLSFALKTNEKIKTEFLIKKIKNLNDGNKSVLSRREKLIQMLSKL